MKNLTIIGGGPAALILAAQLDTRKYQVTLCEKKKAVGRKFLVAGEGARTSGETKEKLRGAWSGVG